MRPAARPVNAITRKIALFALRRSGIGTGARNSSSCSKSCDVTHYTSGKPMSKLKEALKVLVDENGRRRGTGKTTTMLKHALAKARSGTTVYIMGWDQEQVQELMRTVQTYEEFLVLGPNAHVSYAAGDIQLPHPMGQMRFRHVGMPDWDWDHFHIRGMPHGIPIYIDHHASERKYDEFMKKEKASGR